MDMSPYPGLRPFQPKDAEYFFGRDQQTDEIVQRLKERRFVAVIGGSGSGKSSLVLAGVVPRLRAFAIEEAGDFWVPVITTPGTNHVGTDNPIDRLATRFCAEFSGLDGADAARCARLLRTRGGLGCIVDEMVPRLRQGREVKLLKMGGIDPTHEEVRFNFLFLVDQFEELFHHSNAKVAEDCRHLVERMIEQFKQPHPQVCLALTMRSEHLNDCPRYEELPDAINATFYLVRRLDAGQLKEAIEQPALHFLRKRYTARRKSAAGESPAPDMLSTGSIEARAEFDEALTRRLLADAGRIMQEQDHADQLPLLQHVLFWTWRCGTRGHPDGAPDGLGLDDLARAVNVSEGRPEAGELPETLNTLSACLQNRCEAIFGAPTQQQARWKEVFRNLSFKEPATGTYTQRRESLAELVRRPGVNLPDEAALKADLAPWMQPHGYLYWDDGSGTLKVAHETLIRRWERLRRWTDEEDQQFKAYLRLLQDCDAWVQSGRRRRELVVANALRRYEDAGLPAALEDKERLARFHSRTEAKPGAASAAQEARDFLSASRRNRQLSRLGLWAAVVTLLVIVPAAAGIWQLYQAEKHISETEVALHRAYALAAETQVNFPSQFERNEDQQYLLRTALLGAHFYRDGIDKQARLPSYPFLVSAGRGAVLLNSAELGEPRNISALRKVLHGTAWWLRDRVAPEGTPEQAPGFVACAQVGRGPEKGSFLGREGGNRGLVVTRDSLNRMTVYAGSIDANGACALSGQVLATPSGQEGGVGLGISADLTTVVLDFRGYMQFYDLLWDAATEVQSRARVTFLKGPDDVDLPRGEVSVLKASRAPFATDIVFGRKTYRVFDSQLVEVSENVSRLGHALSKGDHAACARTLPGMGSNNRARNVIWSASDPQLKRVYCVEIAPGGESGSSFVALLYAVAKDAPPRALVRRQSLVDAMELGSHPADEIRIDEGSGWIAFRAGDRWRAMPWSMEALQGLAKDVFIPDAAPAERAGAAYHLIIGDAHIPVDARLKASLPVAPLVEEKKRGVQP